MPRCVDAPDMGLVLHNYWKLHRHQPDEIFDDIVQEGYLALLIAKQRFDPSLGVPWGAYASRGIYQHMLRFAVRDKAARTLNGNRDRALTDLVEHYNPIKPTHTHADASLDWACATCGKAVERGDASKSASHVICPSCKRARERAKSAFGGQGICRKHAAIIRSRFNLPYCDAEDGCGFDVEVWGRGC